MFMTYRDPLRPRSYSGHWQDWAILILALVLFFSPWILAFAMPHGAGGAAAASNASWDSWILGVVMFAVALAAIFRLQAWEEWVAALLAIWLIVASFLLGFTIVPGAAWTHWIVGLLVLFFAIWDLRTLRAPLRRPMSQY